MDERGGRHDRQAGLTLVELLVVLVVLGALATMVVPLLGGLEGIATPTGTKSPERIATEVTMTRLRDAIMGSPAGQGYWADVGQRPNRFPKHVAQLFLPPAGASPFDPVTQTGWRGPYLLQPTGRDAAGNPTLIDGWGSPLEIQVDFDGDGAVSDTESRHARIVSAGEDGTLDTPTDPANMVPGSDPAMQLTLTECGDDVVLFLRMADLRR